MNGSGPLSTLPALSADEAEHSAALVALVRERIADQRGWIDFETFMELALYAPGLGYYSAGSAKLGGAGDFTTAPEMSDLFSRCVARQCAQVLGELGSEARILELGAGSGRLAVAVLRELAALGTLPVRYDILEVSADLAQRQRERISQLPAELRQRVHWLSSLPQQPFEGVLLANEVLDALPCQRLVVRPQAPGGIMALGVALAGGALVEREGAASGALAAAWAQLSAELPGALAPGYTTEVCLRVAPFIAGVSAALSRGVLLLFDYGLPRAQYYSAERAMGTLTAYFKHRAHYDPLLNLGVQDLTAWVDFTRVAEAGLAAGLELLGFCPQAAFLMGAGIDQLLAQARDQLEQARLAGEARRLLLPGEMGEAFKLMALGRNWDVPLAAFTYRDLRDSL